MVNNTSNRGKQLIYIAVGSNLGLPKDEVFLIPQSLVDFVAEQAAQNAQTWVFDIESISSFYRTPAFPAGSGPDFVNAVFSVTTDLAPEAVLQHLHGLEDQYGRKREYRWAPRTLDLDLLFVDRQILPDEATWQEWADLTVEEAQTRTPNVLILPHPRAHERAFVLGPMMDIAPEFVHPVLQKSVAQMWHELPQDDRGALIRL